MKKPHSLFGQRLAYLAETHLQGHAVEVVALRFEEDELKIFLCKWKGKGEWSLPVSSVKLDESFEDAAIRLIEESYGVKNAFVKPVALFSDPARKLPDWSIEMFKNALEPDELHLLDWFRGRFITAGYLSFVSPFYSAANSYLIDNSMWVAVEKIPELITNHSEIIERAMRQLRIELSYLPVAKELLPNEFTIQELQKIYEAILGKKLDRANFQRKMLKLDYLVRIGRKKEGAANRAPYLYTIDEAIYEQYMQHGIGYL